MFKSMMVFGFSLAVAAGLGKESKLSANDVDAVLNKYRKAEAFKAKVTKTTANEVIGNETTGDGEFFFSKGKLRLEMGEPENTTVVYDGKTIWMETRLDETTVTVTKIKSHDLKKNDTLLASLFERKDLLKSFALTQAREEDGKKIYTFEPRKRIKTEVRGLEIALEGKTLQRVTYRDDLENRVSFVFKDLKRGSVPASRFKYTPPEGASITDIE